jgi:hypothetical protein
LTSGCAGLVERFAGLRLEEDLDRLVEGGGLVINDEVAGVVDADEVDVGHGGVGSGVERGDVRDRTLRAAS